ncbi:MAG: hypothetical protein M3R04_09315, partial [bacterium]|nr:hypothetical protein [bacterium]
MTSRAISILLTFVLCAATACTSSSSPSVSQGNNNYDSQFRQPNTGAKGTYDQKPAEKLESDTAITVMQLALETGDVYPGQDYYAYAVVDNPTDRKNLQYVWATSDGEIVEVAEAERGRLQTLVEEKYSTVTPATPAAGAIVDPNAPLPATGDLPPGTTSIQPSEIDPTAPGYVPPPMIPGQTPPITDPLTGARSSSGIGPVAPQPETEDEADEANGGAVKTETQRLTRNTRGAYVKRLVAGPEEEAYFTDEEQAEISTASPAETQDEEVLDIVAADQANDIRGLAQQTDREVDETAREIRNGRRNLVTDDQRDEPQGSPNVLEAGNLAGDPYDTGKVRSDRKSTRELDAERGFVSGDAAELADDIRYAEDDSVALRSSDRRDAPDKSDEITPEKAYEKFSLVTDEPFIRWTPRRPGESKLFVKVRWKTDDLTKATKLPVEVRLREPTVKIADDDFPDMVREDENLFIRIDGDNLPAFHKGLFTLSFDPDMLSFREAELGEFFDDAGGAAKLFYAQPDKLSGKVILAIDSATELTELSGGDPLLYVKFKAKRDINTRDETQLALVQDPASQYVLDGSGDNILPMAVDHPVYATALVRPPRYGAESGVQRELTPGQPTPNQLAAAAEAKKNPQPVGGGAVVDGTTIVPLTDTSTVGTGGTAGGVVAV